MWDYFDDIQVITIPNSKFIDGFKKNMQEVGIKNYKINVFPKTEDGVNVDEKCKWYYYLNKKTIKKCCGQVCRDLVQHHLSIIRNAYNNNKQNVLIFEDDARFDKNISPQKLQRIKNWLQTHNWDIFYFGQIQMSFLPIGIPVSQDVMKVYKPILAHAYVLNRSAMKYILDNIDPTINIDETFMNIPLEKYAVYPNLNFQPASAALKKILPNSPKYFKSVWKLYDFISYWGIIIMVIVLIILLIILLINLNKR